MKAYSMDLRQRVIGASDADQRTTEVAKTFGISPLWVRRLKQHRRESGDIRPRNGGGSRGRKIDHVRLADPVKQQLDATLVQLRDSLGIAVRPQPLRAPAADWLDDLGGVEWLPSSLDVHGRRYRPAATGS